MSEPRQKWTNERVIHAILERQSNGLPLSADAMNRGCGALFGAGVRLFGSWIKALQAAGIDPEIVKAARKTANQWSKDLIISKIQEHALLGHELSAHRLAVIDSPLVASAPRYCGTWDNALKMAGFDPESIRLTGKWTSEKVIDRIQQINRDRGDLSDQSAAAYDQALYGAATTHFGGWKQAVEAAGIDYGMVRRIKEDWTKERLIEEMKRMHSYGVNLNAGANYTGLYPQIIKFLGGMDELYRAIGEIEATDDKLFCFLRQFREESKLSQMDLGESVGRSFRAIGLYESGAIIPPLTIALKISAKLNKTVNQIWKVKASQITVKKENK